MNTRKRNLIEIHAAVLLFGLAGLFGKLVTLPSVLIVLGRVFFATIALFIVLIINKQNFRLKSIKDYCLLSLLGIILAIHWTTFFQSIQISSVAIGLLSFSTFPVFVTFLEPFLFKEKIKANNIIVSFITFIGAVLVIPTFDLSNNITQGVIWGLVSAFTFAILSLLNRKYVKSYSSLLIAFYQDGIATIVLLPFLFIIKPEIQLKDIFLLALLGIFFTALAHTLFIKGMTYIKTQTASIIASLEPVYGIIFALFLFKEIPSLRTVIGGIIILGAVFYSSLKTKVVKELTVPE